MRSSEVSQLSVCSQFISKGRIELSMAECKWLLFNGCHVSLSPFPCWFLWDLFRIEFMALEGLLIILSVLCGCFSFVCLQIV